MWECLSLCWDPVSLARSGYPWMPGGFFNSYNPPRAFLYHGPDPSKVRELFPQPSSLPLCWHTLSLPMKLLLKPDSCNEWVVLSCRAKTALQQYLAWSKTNWIYGHPSCLLKEEQEILLTPYICTSHLGLHFSQVQGAALQKQFEWSGLQCTWEFSWGSFFTQRTRGGLFWFFGFFFPELPGLSDRTISHRFPFGPPILCFCCSLVCVGARVCVCARLSVWVWDLTFGFPFFCVKIFFYRFSRVNHCLLYEYFNELYTVWMKCYLKRKKPNCCIP